MLGRSVTFGPKSVEKCTQQGNFFELTAPSTRALTKSFGTDQYIIFHHNHIISATIIDIKQKEKSSVQSLLDRCDIIISVIFLPHTTFNTYSSKSNLNCHKEQV